MPSIRIKQWALPLIAERSTILDTALKAGVPYPHGCRVGECGACKSSLLSGDVRRLEASPDALTEEECAQGQFLACRCIATGDVEIEWLAAQPKRAARKARVVMMEAATHDICRIRLRLEGEPFAFRAGQYAMLKPGPVPARAYSMASHPDDPVLEFHVRQVPGGVTSAYIGRQLRIGDAVELEGPLGSAHWRDNPGQPLLLAAGGSGLAPMLSILRIALATPRPIRLYHGVREERDLYAIEELNRLGANRLFSYRPVLSARAPGCAPDSTVREGFLHEVIQKENPRLAGCAVYMAGPPPMVDAVKAVVRAQGAHADDIHADAFHAAGAAPAGEKRGMLARLFRR